MSRVAVAMSGGVDSAVSALMLKEQGYDAVGVTFILTEESYIAAEDAKKVCDCIGIEHVVKDYTMLFKEHVINPFINGYIDASTPNPCVFCNKGIKFGEFYNQSMAEGFDFISTGHYARVIKDENGFHLTRAKNLIKDQSYVLYQLTQEELSHILLPLGECAQPKSQLRAWLSEKNIPVAYRPDSQDICFIPDGDYAKYIESKTDVPKIGNFISEDGKILGKHSGHYSYTLGQRKGLGISLGTPAFVSDINPITKNITLTTNENKLYTKKVTCEKASFCSEQKVSVFNALLKLRYAHIPAEAVVKINNGNSFEVEFLEPQRAPTRGQSGVIYVGEEVIGGGIIK